MTSRRPARPVYQQSAQQAAQARLPWVLGGLGLLILLLLAGSGGLWYRGTRPLAQLTRLEGVVSWMEIRRTGLRPYPYELRFATHEQNRVLEVYLGQSKELADYYARYLHVGDSVRVTYYDDPVKGSPLVYQLEQADRVLLAAEGRWSENKVGAVILALLGLLALGLSLGNRHMREVIKSYFRGRTA